MNKSMGNKSTGKAILYTRVSTGEQADHGTSLAGQLEACRNKAKAMGATVVDAYEDAGISGAIYEGRHGLQAALRRIDAREADCLIMANLSRFSRDREHQSAIKKRVEVAGARLVFCDMEFADTPEGDLAFGIMGTFADYERKAIKKRTMEGRQRRALEGIQPCRNHSPFGYHVVTSKDVLSGSYPPETLGTYQVVEEQARWVKEMFIRYAGGETLRGIARWLTQSGVPTPRGGAAWNQSTLLRLFQHPVYKGVAPFGRFERCHDESRVQRGYKTSYVLRARPEEEWISIEAPALTNESTWNACQERMTRNRDVLTGRPDLKYMLTGLMRCPHCGRKMRCNRRRASRKNKELPHLNFYECRFARPSTNLKGEVCHNKQYRGDWAEPLVINAIEEAARNPELARAALEAYKLAQADNSPKSDPAHLKRQLAHFERQERATITAQIAGVMEGADPNLYGAALRKIADKRSHVTQLLEQLAQGANKQKHCSDESDVVVQALSNLREVLNAPEGCLTPAEKQGLLSKIVEAIYPEGEGGLKIFLQPPIAPNPNSVSSNVQYFTT